MEQKKTYRTFQFGNVVWKSAFRGTLSASGHPNVEIGTPRYSRELLTCGVPKTVDWSVERLLMLTFLYQMQRRQLEVVAYESSAQGTLEHHDGKHRVTRILVQPRISLTSGDDVEAAREAI